MNLHQNQNKGHLAGWFEDTLTVFETCRIGARLGPTEEVTVSIAWGGVDDIHTVDNKNNQALLWP